MHALKLRLFGKGLLMCSINNILDIRKVTDDILRVSCCIIYLALNLTQSANIRQRKLPNWYSQCS
jgi:hypothetical protein